MFACTASPAYATLWRSDAKRTAAGHEHLRVLVAREYLVEECPLGDRRRGGGDEAVDDQVVDIEPLG
jgi:hypothetical protein